MKDAKMTEYPACFGVLDSVFPKGEDDLRNTPETCLVCLHKTECLRSAMGGTKGLKVREEFIQRAYESGIMSFMERWSEKKDLWRKMKGKRSKT